MTQNQFSNPAGAVCIAEGGVPRTITFKARNNISGGYWVIGSSSNGVVGSLGMSYAAGDIEGYTVATQVGSQVIGLCLQDTASGTYGTAAQRGTYLFPCLSGTILGSVYAGVKVTAGSAGTVVPYVSGTIFALGVGPIDPTVGRSLTNGDVNGEFVAVSLNI